MVTHRSILLIDDSPGECELFRMALAHTYLDVALYTEHDAKAALHFLTDRTIHEALPSVVLLDWHLAKHHGDEFLRRLRSDARFTSIPVVVFTTSDVSSDRASAYASGANGYVVKPGTFDELVHCVGDICRYWLDRNRTAYMVETRC